MPTFTGINYYVCCYCKYIHNYDTGHGGLVSKCALDKKLIRHEGCRKFIPSGLPAHPKVWGELVKLNHITSIIPQNINATETSYELIDKIGLRTCRLLEADIEKRKTS